MINVKHWYKIGGHIKSSGTTGQPKEYWQPVEKISAAGDVSVESQSLNRKSRVLTVCKIDHAGGLFAQTLPALFYNIPVDIEPFNAFNFHERMRQYTHTHLTPHHIRLLTRTKGYHEARYDGKFIACGSDCVEWWMIEYFVHRGATFMANWGMSEVGPIAINTLFDNMDKVNEFKRLCPEDHTILGDRKYCDYKLEDDGELVIRGAISIFGDTWYNTGDIVTEINGILFYKRRK
jgi:acyl-coenzyme A synthetase/AMP-(fatty) acid ligase